MALLEADVSLPVARAIHQGGARKRRPVQAVTKSVTPGQQVVKIVHDELKATRSDRRQATPVSLKIDNPPAPILMVGLQGSRQNHNHGETRQTPERKAKTNAS